MKPLLQNFEEVALPHLEAAYNLARWLTRNETDAEDIVQEAFLKAFRHFDTFHGDDGRPWLLAIVRNTCYTWMRQKRSVDLQIDLDEEIFISTDDLNPEMLLLKEANEQLVRKALEELPVEFREVIVLREFEELSYKQIANIAKIPLGTVMSRLSRARKGLQQILGNCRRKGTTEAVTVGAS